MKRQHLLPPIPHSYADGCLHLLGPERYVVEPLSSGMPNGIGNRRRSGTLGRFARSEERLARPIQGQISR